MNTGGGFSSNPGNALNTTASYYDQNGTLVPSAAPYQLFTQSSTLYSGDTVYEYNTYAPDDLTYNYAFSNSPATPATTLPPGFRTAPGGAGATSSYGVEWTLDPTIFASGTLSDVTASNAGMMAVLRFNHPTWNWFDVKAALRQTGSNWATGYNKDTYGFGQVNYASSTALVDNQILLQPPEVSTTTSGAYGQITFTIFPFRQTRRVKDVLFEFATSSPGFQGNELTLAQIQALGGTKITEYTGTTATTSAPIFTPVTNAYFVWLAADNSNDSVAHFSRIDTYSILGPLSQGEISFANSFDTASPASNTVSATASPTFTWNAAQSHFGVSKYQLFIDGVLNKDNISGTSATPSSSLSEGAHTWYVKAFNGNGTATTTTSTPTININTAYAPGYTFYVDNVLGSDNNPGSQASPWATLTKAGLTASAGDTVAIVKNSGVPYRDTLAPVNSGTVTAPITFRGVDATTKPEIWGSVDVTNGWSVYSGGNSSTYSQAFATSTTVVEAGSSLTTLTKRTKGSSAATLNPGEWFWASGTLYYRLGAGETINSLHIEAASRNYGISSSAPSYVTYQNLIVRYANANGALISGTNQTAEGIEIYDSYQGIQVGGTNALVQYVVAARNNTAGINVFFPQNGKVYNALSYGNGTNGVTFFGYTGVGITLKDIIASANPTYSFGTGALWSPPTFSTSNNLWDIAGDTNWNTYKGTFNQELVNPLLTNPSASDFSLTQLSPAIDTGTAIAGVTTDILGNPIYGT
ncbi:MAG: hypothetical protein ACYC1Y_02410, partial [Minisyncoccota bacterium]